MGCVSARRVSHISEAWSYGDIIFVGALVSFHYFAPVDRESVMVCFVEPLFYNPLMLRRVSKLVLVFFIGWLPIQTFAMVVNPPCEHNQQGEQASRSDAQASRHQHHQHHQHHASDRSSGQSDSSCAKCALCVICSFTALVSFPPLRTEGSAASFIGTEPSVFSTVYLDLPLRPPRISSL
jgi:hypothetical protein